MASGYDTGWLPVNRNLKKPWTLTEFEDILVFYRVFVFLQAGESINLVGWRKIDFSETMYAAHLYILKLVAMKHDAAFWTGNTTLRSEQETRRSVRRQNFRTQCLNMRNDAAFKHETQHSEHGIGGCVLNLIRCQKLDIYLQLWHGNITELYL